MPSGAPSGYIPLTGAAPLSCYPGPVELRALGLTNASAAPGQKPAPRPAEPQAPQDVFTRAEAPPEPKRPSVAALAALALVVASAVLTGCGGPAAPPTGAGEGKPTPVKENPTGAQVPLATRLERLRKEDRKLYKRLAEANLYRHVLQRIPADSPLASTAKKGLDLFASENDPEKLRDGMRAVVRQIAETKTQPLEVGTWQGVATSALRMGSAIEDAAVTRDPGLVDRLKASGYEKALQQMLTLPQQLADRGVVTPEQAKAYVALFTETAQAALDTGADLKDPALAGPLYAETVSQLYERTGNDSSEAARLIRQALELAMKLKDRLPLP